MQFDGDAHNAHILGVPAHAISKVGSIKLDQPAPQIVRNQANRISAWKKAHVLVCLMSSHPDDDALLLSWARRNRGLRLLIVPRHPVRGSEIKMAAINEDLSVCQSSLEIDHSAQILIGDTFGDMGAYLSQSDVVVIGGSFSGKGGQNPIEPALLSKPLVAGPSMHNFQAIGDGLEAAGGLIRADADQISEAIEAALLGTNKLGQAARAWVIANRGSTDLQAQSILATLATD
jgi:3-deoxy-D-manno-octulosonic-acid transferase